MIPVFAVRSLLFTPATRPDRFARAVSSGADAVVVDLEDSVAISEKDIARRQALDWLSQSPSCHVLRGLRINSPFTEHGTADLRALRASDARPDFLVIPKIASPAEIVELAAQLQDKHAEVRFVALIESARAVLQVDAIAACNQRLVALLFGASDLSVDLRSDRTWDALLYARSRLICAAAAAGVEAIDSPCLEVTSENAVLEEATKARMLGFTGMAAIHPKHISPIHAAFTPSVAEIELARRIVVESGKGVSVLDGQMIDEAAARRARRILGLVRGAG